MGLTGGFIGWIKIDFEGEALKFICHTANDLHHLEGQSNENILVTWVRHKKETKKKPLKL